MRIEQEIGRHDDGAQHIIEVVGDAAGELADQLHGLRGVDLALQMALLGGLERVDDGGLLIALLLLDGGDVETGEALAGAFERGVDRRDLALPLAGLADRRLEHAAVALGDDVEDRAVGGAFALEHRMEQRGQKGHSTRDLALLVDRGDRHGRVVEEARESHLGGALRVGAVVAGAVEHQRARGSGHPVGAEGDLVEQPRRQRVPAAGLEIDDRAPRSARRRARRRAWSRARRPRRPRCRRA